jgi:hypothetical protein
VGLCTHVLVCVFPNSWVEGKQTLYFRDPPGGPFGFSAIPRRAVYAGVLLWEKQTLTLTLCPGCACRMQKLGCS